MLSDKDIKELIDNNQLCIEPYSEKNIGCASIDLSLGSDFIQYTGMIDTNFDDFEHVQFNNSELLLKPGQFILGRTREKIKLSGGYYGFIETRGNFARAGISVTCDDGHIDPGTEGTITLEIKNNNNVDIKLYAGTYICQLFLFKLSSNCLKKYDGKYKRQSFPTMYRR